MTQPQHAAVLVLTFGSVIGLQSTANPPSGSNQELAAFKSNNNNN